VKRLKTLSLRLPEDLHGRMKRDADTPGRRMSLSQWIRNACEGVLVARNQPDRAGPNQT